MLLKRWAGLVQGRPYLVASAAVVLFNLMVYVFAAAKDLMVAYLFGRSDDLDAFLIALVIFVFLINTFGGSFAGAAVPTFMRVRQTQGREAAVGVLSNTVVLTCIVLSAVGLLTALYAPALLSEFSPDFTPAKRELTRTLLLLLLPSMVLGGVTSIWGPTLNAHGRYMVAATTPVFGSLATLALLLVLGTSIGTVVLALGISIGSVLEVAALAVYMRRLGLAFLPRWRGFDAPTREVLDHCGVLVAASSISVGAILVDQTMAASLGSGSVAALSYGSKLVTVFIGVTSVAATSVLFPQFSRLAAAHDAAALRRLFYNYLGLALVISTLATLLLAGLSEPLIRLFFRRGAFTEDDARIVSSVQRVFALQIPFHVCGLIAARLLTALNQNHVLVFIGSVTLVADIVSNYLLMQLLGVAGIALATSFVFAGSCAMLMVAVVRALPRIERTAQSTADA